MQTSDMEKTVAVSIPSLGRVTGIHDTRQGLQRFLGIPYASLSQRWTRATPLRSFAGGEHDGTKYGPICPQLSLPNMPSITQMAVAGFPANPETVMDEFACLNMNITRSDSKATGLPVMVWIHGGGFAVGSNTELVYDGVQIVKESVKAGSEVIYVAINYRLNYFGFLASEEMKEENLGGAVGNYGLWDQRLALEFVQSYISAFGGDPSKVTIFGESAGSASVHAHTLAKEELFSQAICQSGVVRTIGPLPLSHPYIKDTFASLLKYISTGLEPATLSDLRSAPVEAIMAAMAKRADAVLLVCFITDDTNMEGAFFPKDTDWISPSPFCKRLIIGDCAADGTVMAQSMMKIPPPALTNLLFKQPGLPSTLLRTYGFTRPETVDHMITGPPLITRLIDLQNGLAFFGPTEAVIASAKKASTYVYRFNRRNRWPGRTTPFTDIAHHTIDLLYLAGVPSSHPTKDLDTDLKLSNSMIHMWVRFAAGLEPWKALGEEGWELVFTDLGDVKEDTRANIRSRNYVGVVDVFEKETVDKVRDINVAFSTGKLAGF